jgi:hypothetical protein
VHDDVVVAGEVAGDGEADAAGGSGDEGGLHAASLPRAPDAGPAAT